MENEQHFVCEPFGPVYPDLGAGVAKHRKVAARVGFEALSREQRQAYGESVETAIRAKQRSELQRALVSHPCPCVSGTYAQHGRSHRARGAIKAAQRITGLPISGAARSHGRAVALYVRRRDAREEEAAQ